ncbi:bifunctional diguanylate cyclase/phosphodiesterase [Rhodopila sp.]|uniref:bifunctional diguanylate cyclase/phosphodiesterase n=1 Tax=Rhodopila sp. TaxID=2480087 RepID=UPI003D0C9FD6
MNAQSASHLLREFNFQTFAFRDIILLRADGGIWASARPNPWNRSFPVDLLKISGGTSGGAASIAGPLRNPVTGDWVLLMVRQVPVAHVGLLYALAEIPLPLITELLSAVGDTPGIQVALERRDGQLLVSQPYDGMRIGKIQHIPISQLQANGVAFLVPRNLMHAPTLGVARASLYPDVMVALTLDLKIAMADWVRDRNRLIALVTVAIVLLSAMTTVLAAALRQRERADAERSRTRATLDSAIESMSDAFVMWDSQDRLVACNGQYRRMYDRSAPFIKPGARFEDIIRGGALNGQYPEATDDIEQFVADTVAWHRHNQGPIERELPGSRWALVTEQRIADGGIVGIRTDITEMRRTLANLAAANERAKQAVAEVQQQNVALTERDRALHIQNVLFDAALNNMSQGLLMTDGDGRLIVYNKRFLEVFAIEPELIFPGIPVSEIFAGMKSSGGLPIEAVENTYLKQRNLADARQSGSFVVTGEAGRAVSVSQRPIADGGWIATYEDVSEQRRAEEHIRFAAHHDALTKLPNRILFRIHLDEMITNLAHRNAGLALLYLDLDRFKHVNDTLGHSVGDALLEAAGRRLRGCLRGRDVVARLGGDEFAIAYVSADLPNAAEHLAQRIISALSAPYTIVGHTVTVGASVGIALAGTEKVDADTLLKRGDMALYQAKAKGRGVCSLFEADMERQLVTRLAIEEDLHSALDGQQFEVLYQPLYDLSSDRVVGFEALVRWNHPVRGTVPPSQFIQIAEETGLIHSIGAWVLNKACMDAMKLPDDIKVAVNLSARQFDNDDIVEIVAAALEISGLPANRLELEITETTLLKNDALTLALLFRLRALGLRIALDDFGTGYSSLTYLRLFPFDKIKIDQSFVREMATRADCAAIVSSIVSMASKLGITTTAEGIETIDQLNLVRETGCTEAQGYLFSVPRTCQDILDYFGSSSDPVASIQEHPVTSMD